MSGEAQTRPAAPSIACADAPTRAQVRVARTLLDVLSADASDAYERWHALRGARVDAGASARTAADAFGAYVRAVERVNGCVRLAEALAIALSDAYEPHDPLERPIPLPDAPAGTLPHSAAGE